MDFFNGELTTNKITVNGDIIFTGTIQGDGSLLTGVVATSWAGGTVTSAVTFENTINVNAPAVSGAEILTTYRVSDASVNDFLSIQNTTETASSFVPGLWSRQNSGNLPSLYLIQQVPDNVTTNSAIVIDCRTPSASVLTNRPLMVVRNFTTNVLTIEANSNVRLNGGALVFPDTAKSISGGAGAVMNINAGVNSMIFRGTSNAFMRGTTSGVGIEIAGTPSINNSALLTITSTTQGFLPPRMTTVQRNAISSPAAGLLIFNTTTNKHEGYDGTTWNAFY